MRVELQAELFCRYINFFRKPGWRVAVVDMVMHEVTRNQTLTSAKLAKWVTRHQLTFPRPSASSLTSLRQTRHARCWTWVFAPVNTLK